MDTSKISRSSSSQGRVMWTRSSPLRRRASRITSLSRLRRMSCSEKWPAFSREHRLNRGVRRTPRGPPRLFRYGSKHSSCSKHSQLRAHVPGKCPANATVVGGPDVCKGRFLFCSDAFDRVVAVLVPRGCELTATTCSGRTTWCACGERRRIASLGRRRRVPPKTTVQETGARWETGGRLFSDRHCDGGRTRALNVFTIHPPYPSTRAYGSMF
jgi:hypothetical protein